MTLYRQILIVILVVFPLLFVGTLTVAVERTRTFLKDQLQSHAQDTATSLGLSLSPHMPQEDLPTMSRMVDAIFDRGYYREIRVVKTDGTPMIVKQQDVTIEGVPAWFIARLPLDTPEAEAAVMAGWKLAASVYVRSHPGYAHNQLWQTVSQLFYWFAGLALLALLLALVALHYLLKPLQAVERQAEALCARKYQFQERLPRTRELRRVVVAMNRMTEKVKAMFAEQASSAERLREQAYLDTLTGLGNRRFFDSQLQARLVESEEAAHGALFLVQLKDLRGLNERLGFEAGDRLVVTAARVIEQVVAGFAEAVVARLTGADFGLLAPSVSTRQADELAQRLAESLARMSSQDLTESGNVGHVGAAMYETGRKPAELLSEADAALRAAQSAGENAWYRYEAREPAMPGRQEWKTRLEQTINAGKVVLEGQAVVDAAHPERVMHRELFVRIPNPEGGLWNAGLFMPTAEQLGLARDIDRIVVRQVLEYLGSRSEPVPVAVNLSPASLRDEGFVGWLLGALDRAGVLRAGIVFELPEFGAVRELDAVRSFASRVRALGHGIALDHFGRSFSSFGYLQSLRPEYVKIDRAYTRLEDHDDQFFVESLCSVAHSLDILTIAEGVEDQERWEALKALHVDGIQGYAVGRPEGL